jgi:hypothetical protein
MSTVAGPVHAAALVLAAAGLAKLLRPTGTVAALRTLGLPGSRVSARTLGAAEVLIGGAVLGGVGAAAVAAALLHVGFAVAAAALRRTEANCGCFGAGAPVTAVHIGAALLAAGFLAAAAIDGTASLGEAVAATPAAGLPYVLLVGLLAAGEVLSLTVLPETQVAARHVPNPFLGGSTPVAGIQSPKNGMRAR